MDKKYLVIEQHKFSTFNDSWTIKFADVDEDTAFKKLVAFFNDSPQENPRFNKGMVTFSNAVKSLSKLFC